MKLPFSLRASLSLSMVGLALLVAFLAIGIHLTLAVHDVVQSSVARSQALAEQTAWLATRAARGGSGSIGDAIERDRALRSLFQSALAGDPTILDLAVVDRAGRALLHSAGLDGRIVQRRPDLEELQRGSVLRLGARVLGPSRAFEARVPLVSQGRPFGEVRVGVATALMKIALLDSLRAGLWMTALALLLAILGALLSAELVGRRVRAMSTGLERLSGGEFGYRLAVEGKDELSHLASSINTLGDRLESMRRRAAAGTMDHREMLDATGQASAWTRVISGLTHELADPLHAASLHLGLLRSRWKEAPPEAARELEVVADEFTRLRGVLQRFREFSVHGETQFDWLDLRALLEQEVDRARWSAPAGIEIRLDVERAPERFWADGSLLRQALTNLISNAIQAMPEGGRMTVAAERLDGYVAVSVRDEGPGIPEALQQQVFDVHFTTKPSGSGIGLAVVKRVVKLHRGQVRLRSKPGEGTVVVLELPESRLEPVGVA